MKPFEEKLYRLREALKRVVESNQGQCENYTTGIGSCFSYGRSPDARYSAERCCNPCIAHAALEQEAKSQACDEG